MTKAPIVATWSGGIDSTAVIAQLLARGEDVHAVTVLFGGDRYMEREARARGWLIPYLESIQGEGNGRGHIRFATLDGTFLRAFSTADGEIPTRNKRIIDALLARHVGCREIAMGEYVGCDTWVVRDHVGAADCDARSLTSYVYFEYGLDYRLWTLADFGESRYKSDRLKLGIDILGSVVMSHTTNCLHDLITHCGRCYKCVERAVAFAILEEEDLTVYTEDPLDDNAPSKTLTLAAAYRRQMTGEDVELPYVQT